MFEIFSGLSSSIPAGIYLDSLIRERSHLILVGVAESALELAQFMKKLGMHPAFNEPILVETQAIQEGAIPGLRFHLTVKTFFEEEKEERDDLSAR